MLRKLVDIGAGKWSSVSRVQKSLRTSQTTMEPKTQTQKDFVV